MEEEKQIEEMVKLLHLNYDMPYEFSEGLAEFLIDEGYRKASDVAREIFELVECAFSPAFDYNGYTVRAYIAELKKKYTKGEK